MPHVVTENCIRCKYTDCVTVCPVHCFYEGETMLVIHPEECIDCGVCVPECPTSAIVSDDHPVAREWVDINAHFSSVWPSLSFPQKPPADAATFNGLTNKRHDFFSELPGDGDA